MGPEGPKDKNKREKREEKTKERKEKRREKRKKREKKKEVRKETRASNGQRYPLPCCTHFGNLKCGQEGKGYC